MEWPPQVGEPLPRAAECWHEAIKFEGWILAPHGHGPEWDRVFHVASGDRERVWTALAAAVIEAEITEVRDRASAGIVCGVKAQVTIGDRTATVAMSWHYQAADTAPRLVTAYPSP
jgi:hypothetical protein